MMDRVMMATDWRTMTPKDIPQVLAVAARVHADYPEDEAVFQERLRLYPKGCLILAGKNESETCSGHGYLISHPWMDRKIPALNSLLGALPSQADTYYIHDLALLPETRGMGHARKLMELLRSAVRDDGYKKLSLVAVHQSASFWERFGFRVVRDHQLEEKLRSYDEDARFMSADV